MTSNIEFLPNHLINQIAAGEVIENPSSVIKELTENSLDANAQKIEIEIKAGGMLFIKISDDGNGMTKEDLKMSIQRHATSKIKNFDDLENINTMGFRGEALASIASISKCKIESAKNGIGHFIYVEGENVSEPEISPLECGTQIEIKSLFYNVPVRKKFQKSTSALIADIVKTVNKIALANPDVSFTLISDGKKLIDAKKEKEKSFKEKMHSRIKTILGEDILKNLSWIEENKPCFQIQGFIGNPFFSKKNKTGQYLFLNKRPVLSPVISEAIKEGYATRISENEYPFFILHINTDNKFIDVNVHPQKKTVRISEPQFLRQNLQQSISNGFSNVLNDVSFEEPVFFQEQVKFNNEKYKACFFQEKERDNDLNIFEKFRQESLFPPAEEKKRIFTREIALMGQYFLMESPKSSKELIAVDLKAAGFKIFFEQLKPSSQKHENASQTLAFPITLDFMPDEILFIEDNLNTFESMGFIVRILGNKTVAIDAMPPFAVKENFLDDVLKEILLFGKSFADIKILEKKLAQKISKTRPQNYTSEEAKQILKKLSAPYYDPLGNPIIIKIDLDDFAKIFEKKKGSICHF